MSWGPKPKKPKSKPRAKRAVAGQDPAARPTPAQLPPAPRLAGTTLTDLERADVIDAIQAWLGANKLGKAPPQGQRRNHDSPTTNRKRVRLEKLMERLEQE